MGNRRWMRRLFVVVAACAVLAGCGSNTAKNGAGEQQDKAISVQVQEVTVGSLSQINEIYASTAPLADVNVMPKLSGELIKVNVENQAFVEKGQTLAVIDHESLLIQLKLEEFTLDQALDNYKNLHTSQASQSQIDQAERSVEQAKLRLQLANLNVQNAYIKSPIDGVVASIHAESGETVSPGAPLFRIISFDPIKVTANVSPNQMKQLSELKQIPVRFPDLGRSDEAKITQVAQIADSSGLFAVEAEVANPDLDIKPGMTAVLFVEQTLVSEGWLVPSEAIVEQADHAFVYVVKNERAVQVPVDIIESQSDVTAVEGALSAGELVVTKGQMLLTDNQLVTIVEEAR